MYPQNLITLEAANASTTFTPYRFGRIDSYTNPSNAWDTSAIDFSGIVFPVTTAADQANCVIYSSHNGVASAQGLSVVVQIGGAVKVEIGGLFNCGDPITTDANGKAVKATSGQYVAGYALETITTFKQSNRTYTYIQLVAFNTGTDGLGHFLANGSGITTAIGNGFGIITQTGNSSRGNISVATGGAFPSTNIINHTFTYPYAYAPTVIVSPTNALTAAQTPYVSASSTTGFTVTLVSTASNQTYAYNYMVIA